MGNPPRRPLAVRFRRRMSDRWYYLLLALLCLAGALAGGWLAMLAYKAMGG